MTPILKSNNRQQVRREMFREACGRMPYWETWSTTETPNITPSKRDDLVSMYSLSAIYPESTEPPKVRYHFKIIPRAKRRDMARKLAKQSWLGREIG